MRACSCRCSATPGSAAARCRRWTPRTASSSAASAAELRIKNTPQLQFVYDDTPERGMRITRAARPGRPVLMGGSNGSLSARERGAAGDPRARALLPDHARASRRRRRRLAGRHAAGADGARQGRARVPARRGVPAARTSTASSSSRGWSPSRPRTSPSATLIFLDCGNIDRSPPTCSSATTQLIINIDHHHDNTRFGDDQPRRPARLVHGRDGVGPDARARRAGHAARSPRRSTSAWSPTRAASCTRTPARARTRWRPS